jgi:hypothetical protein
MSLTSSTTVRTELPLLAQYLHKLEDSGYSPENVTLEKLWLEGYVESNYILSDICIEYSRAYRRYQEFEHCQWRASL